MTDAILVINAGSSSIKFALYACCPDNPDSTPIAGGEISGIGDAPRIIIREGQAKPTVQHQLAKGSSHEDLFQLLLNWIHDHSAGLRLIAAGHRVVHGGTQFDTPVLVDDSVFERLEQLVPLAPLHQPHNLAAIRCLARAEPGLQQVACFDTGFHRTNSSLATAFALPRELSGEGVRRYGFHGLSYEYISTVLPGYAGGAAGGRVVVAHLGHGASMCALRDGRSIASTMGFTALDGLPMGRRCGAIDPGVLLYLMKEKGMDYDALSDLLYRRSGLLGVSGVSDDMRELLASPSAEARRAVDLFAYRADRELGSLAAALGGLDVLVFTAGIGEHAAPVRERICRGAQWLGIELDEGANQRGNECISRADSAVAVYVIPTDEDLMIARHCVSVLKRHGYAGPALPPAGVAIVN